MDVFPLIVLCLVNIDYPSFSGATFLDKTHLVGSLTNLLTYPAESFLDSGILWNILHMVILEHLVSYLYPN